MISDEDKIAKPIIIRKQMTQKRLQIFSKAPVQGQVKTRLIPDLGEQGACDVYLNLLERSVSLAVQSGYKTQLWCAPDQRHAYFQTQAENNAVELHEQYGSNLGERMYHALHEGLESAEKVVLIGADCPVFTVAYWAKAFDALSRSDVVLGPAEDGGFVLVACRKTHRGMFNGVNWGHSTVLEQTLAALESAKLTHHLLPMLWDVDTFDDLKRWRAIKGDCA